MWDTPAALCSGGDRESLTGRVEMGDLGRRVNQHGALPEGVPCASASHASRIGSLKHPAI